MVGVGRRLLLFAFLVAVSSACSKASEESSAKRSPLSPPPRESVVPADLRIPVEVDGEKAEPITAERLSKLAPDFSDKDRRAWRLTRVLGSAFESPDAVVDAVGKAGVAISMSRPANDAAPQPVLYLTRRGDVVAAVVEPKDPFPDYHGQGGRLRRPGDPLPRVLEVARLRVRSSGGEAKAKPGQGAEPSALIESVEVSVGEGEPRPLTAEELARLPGVVLPGDTGDARSAWSLRHLARAVAGKEATIARVSGVGGAVELEPKKWSDESLTPILRANRRGQLVFHWIDSSGQTRGGSLRGVRRIDVAE